MEVRLFSSGAEIMPRHSVTDRPARSLFSADIKSTLFVVKLTLEGASLDDSWQFVER